MLLLFTCLHLISCDIITDMINMMKLNFLPQCAEWVHSLGDAIPALAMLVTAQNVFIIFGSGIGANIYNLKIDFGKLKTTQNLAKVMNI